MKKAVLKNFAMFAGKLQPTTLLKTLQHRCFSLNIAKFLRTSTQWAAASVMTFLSSSDNLLTGYEQLSY